MLYEGLENGKLWGIHSVMSWREGEECLEVGVQLVAYGRGVCRESRGSGEKEGSE